MGVAGSLGVSQQGPYLGVLGRVVPAARVVGGVVPWTLSDWTPCCLAGCCSGSEATLGSLLSPPHPSSREAPSGHVPRARDVSRALNLPVRSHPSPRSQRVRDEVTHTRAVSLRPPGSSP